MDDRSGIDASRLLDAVGQAVIATDADGRILFWNRGAEELYGWPAVEVLGRPVLDVTPATHTEPEAAAILERLQAGESWSGELWLRRRSGETFLAAVTDSPVLDGAGRLAGTIGVSEDVTDRRWAEAELRRSEQRLRVALRAGRLGIWEWNCSSGAVAWDATVEAMFAVPPGAFGGTFDEYLERVHPEDRAEVLAAIEKAASGAGDLHVEHRVVRPDGTVRWLEGRGTTAELGGRSPGMIGVTADVTDRHDAEVERQRLLEAEAAARADAEAARERIQFLADATTTLNEDLDLDERLRRLVRLVVPRFADGCAVYLLDGDTPERRAVHHRDPARLAGLGRFLDRVPQLLDASTAGAALRRGRTWWQPRISDDLLVSIAQDDGHLQELRRLDLRSAVAVALRGRRGLVGGVAFVHTSDRVMSEADVELAQALCLRAGVAVENAQLVALRNEAEGRLRFQTAVLEAQNEAGIEAELLVGPDGQVLSYNNRFTQLWGFDAEQVAVATDAELLDAAAAKVVDPTAFLRGVRAAYANPTAPNRAEVVLANGRVLDRHGAPVRGPDGEYFGWLWQFRDVTVERAQQRDIVAAGERFASLALVLQQSLLPPSLPIVPGIELAARYHPGLEGLEVGGDFYDVFAVNGGWLLVIGDVCGKGADAAAVTALIRYTVRAAAVRADDPAEILVELNAAMRAQRADDERFATVACIRLEPRPDHVDVMVACAGHPPALLIEEDGTVTRVGGPGTLVGLFDEIDVTSTALTLPPGSVLVALTDGVLEARDRQGRQFDETCFDAVLTAQGGRPVHDVVSAIEAAALAHQGGTARDDIAILAARAARIA